MMTQACTHVITSKLLPTTKVAGIPLLVKLITGLLKPTVGNITINGVDVYDIPNCEKRRLFGYIDQSAHFLEGTVAEQVSLKDESITKEQIEKALDFVSLTEYIATLEKLTWN